MNIVYSSSDLYAPLAGISLVSLLENNKRADEIHVYLLDNGISAQNKRKFSEIIENYQRKLTICAFPKEQLGSGIYVQKWNISTFGRLFDASILPYSVEKVIHLDCDTIVLDTLEPLWNMDMGHAAVAGVPDCLSDVYKKNIGLAPEDSYLNAGCTVLHLARIRELGIEQAFRAYINRNGHMLTYVDQEVLNACVPESEKRIVPMKYNSYSILHYLSRSQLRKMRRVSHMVSPEDYRQAREAPVVVHYTACFLEGTRPWIQGDTHPKRSVFLRYKRQSPWTDMPAWTDARRTRAKLAAYLVRLAPKWMLIPVVGYVHGVYVPNRNKRRQDGKWLAERT